MFRVSIPDMRRIAVRLEQEARVKRMLAQVEDMIMQVQTMKNRPPSDAGTTASLGAWYQDGPVYHARKSFTEY